METSLIRYRIEHREECIRLSQVTEIIPMVQLDPPPEGDQKGCIGLLHYRGRLLPVFDLLKNPKQKELQTSDYLMVMAEKEPASAVRVSEVKEVMTVQSDQIEQVKVGPGEYAELLQLEDSSIQVRRSQWETSLKEAEQVTSSNT
jgi:chemotaxis signal transduction protein